MTCYSPMTGYRARSVNAATGKRSIVFNPNEGFKDMPVELPCGQCIGCRLERSRQWAIRCVHEASLWNHNCFLTLTYNDEKLPTDKGLHVEDFQKFMKRFRRKHKGIEPFEYKGKIKHPIRFFHCGEYGQQCELCGQSKFVCKCKEFVKSIGRPHYHACVFNYDFKDKILFKESRQGEKYYISEELSRLWPQGFSIIGDVTFESAAYVARYITKKVTGPKKEGHYERYDTERVGEGVEVHPEYTTQSRQPGIGYAWYQAFRDETYRDDYVICRGRKMRPPKAYDRIFEKEKVREAFRLKVIRKVNARKHEANNTYERLQDREFCQMEKFKRLKRGIE